MKNKTILLAFFLFASSSWVVAQEKQEHAMVYYGGYPKPVIAVSLNGKSYVETTLEKDATEAKYWYYDLSPAFKQINLLQLEGWILDGHSGMPTIGGGGGYTFLLHRQAK